MQLTIYFNPAEIPFVDANVNDIYIVIDVMRATTTLPILFDQGARRVFAAQTLEQAQEAAQKIPGRILCGERYAKTPSGFDYGNSPAQFAQLDLRGRDLILTTSNGTRALFACPEQSTRLTGSFYNAKAVISLALNLAQARDCNISIVCAAEYGFFALEDTACAGYLALDLLHRNPQLKVHDSTHAAITIYEAYTGSRLIECAQSAIDLIAIGQQKDLDFCLRKDGSQSVPSIVGAEPETGLLVLELAQ